MPKNIVSENINLSEDYTALERRAIGRDIIEYLRKRTKSGRGEGNREWRGKAGEYSKGYQSTIEYKLKSQKGTVDLTLSGDMLTAIEIIQNKKGKLQVGIPFGASEWGRGKGNILGSYGGKPNSSKSRPFLKLSKEEVKQILSKYPLEKNREKNQEKLRQQDKILRGS